MHPLEKFKYCPVCGSPQFVISTEKSKKCKCCGFEYFFNPSSAVVAFITNDKGEILVERRKREPAIGTLDLPGGFSDLGETVEESVAREIKEETNLEVTESKYLFSIPNIYRYSDMDIHTLDLFFYCKVKDFSNTKAMDDASECIWIAPHNIKPEEFGLGSIRMGIDRYIKMISERNMTNIPTDKKKERREGTCAFKNEI